MRIASVIDYWREILNIHYCEKDEMLFFRGHSDKSYRLLPGAMRGDGERQESEFYHNIMVEYPEEFRKGEHLSNLVKMQHYCHLTRLLDLTTNPLMALYFASEQYSDKDGQVLCFKVKKSDVLHHTSDKAMMLACPVSILKTDARYLISAARIRELWMTMQSKTVMRCNVFCMKYAVNFLLLKPAS